MGNAGSSSVWSSEAVLLASLGRNRDRYALASRLVVVALRTDRKRSYKKLSTGCDEYKSGCH